MNLARALALSLLTGVLFAFSLPPFDQGWMAWVALTPLLLACSTPGRRPLHAFGLGMLAGVVAGAIHARWHENADGLRYAYLPFLWLGLVFGSFSAAAAWYRPRVPAGNILRWALFVACAGVAAEWATTFSPLPVGVALTQHRTLPIVQVAAFAGTWGVSLLLYLANAAVAASLSARRFWPAAEAALLVALVYAGGWAEYSRAYSSAPRGRLAVAAVQEYSEAEAGRYGASPTPDDMDEEALLERAATTGDAQLIVGSEEGLAAGFRPDDPRDTTMTLAKRSGRAFVVGYQEAAHPKDFNCAAVVDGAGEARSVHRKMKLFLGEKANIQAGESTTVADVPFPGRSPVRVGTLICFDTCYPALVRDESRQGANIIAVPNYDPPVPGMVLHHLHAALMPFRAVENRVALVRSDPNGKSMIVAPSGAIIAESPLFRSQVVTASVPLGNGAGTPYTRYGDWLAYLCAGAALFLVRPRRTEVTQDTARAASKSCP